MNVGEIVAAVDVVQSTVSAHLKVLAEVRFLLSEHQEPPPTTGSTTHAWIASPPPPTSSWAGPRPSPPSPKGAPVADNPASPSRDAVIARYSGLARTALAGATITDCDLGTFTDGGFGAAAYAGTDGAPDGALRASLGCGNPLAVAELHSGQTVLDLGSGGALDVLLSARRSPLAAPPTAGRQPDMLATLPCQRRRGRRHQRHLPARPHRGHPAADRHVDVGHLQLRHQLSTDKPRGPR